MIGTAVIGRATLYQGRCEDVLPRLSSVGAVIVDPPYGIAHASNYGASWEGRQIANDRDTAVRDFVLDWAGDRAAACFASLKAPLPASPRGWLCWDKGPAFGMGDLSFPWKPSFELIAVYGKGWSGRRDEGVLRGSCVPSWESRGRAHPHEKPVWLFEALLRKLPPDLLVLDPWMGTGPCGQACARLGRAFVGVELDPAHFATACRRIDAAGRQPDLLAGSAAA